LSFPTAPIEYNNIFCAAVLNTSDIKTFGFSKCMYKFIELLQDIETNGIVVSINGKERGILFIFGLILGDNLGLNSVLGFSTSFSSNFFCRFYKLSKQETAMAFEVKVELLRNQIN